jgi:H+-transporting ATPase
LEDISYGQITTCIYLKVSVSDFLTLFSSRTGGDWFWAKKPANILLAAGGVAISSSIAVSLSWPASEPDHIVTLGLARSPPYALFAFILGYCLVWWLIQDAAKVLVCYYLQKYNIFGVNDTGAVEGSNAKEEYDQDDMNQPLL